MYTYNITVDVDSSKVDIDKLEIEILNSTITESVDNIGINENTLIINISTLTTSDKAMLDSIIQSHDGIPIEEKLETETRIISTPFASKFVMHDGILKSLFKRVHGVNVTIPSGSTGFLEFTIPYSKSKFTGANIFGGDLKDTVDFFVLDNSVNSYSGAPGSYYVLNQFGFNVEMPPGGVYKNTSNYDADLYPGMIISCAFKNNGDIPKYISMNLWIHEVK